MCVLLLPFSLARRCNSANWKTAFGNATYKYLGVGTVVHEQERQKESEKEKTRK
jgi:hypothetical protein